MAMEREPPVEPDGMWGLEALSFNIRDGFVGTVCSHFSDSMWRGKICVCARKEHEASASEREMNKCVRVKEGTEMGGCICTPPYMNVYACVSCFAIHMRLSACVVFRVCACTYALYTHT